MTSRVKTVLSSVGNAWGKVWRFLVSWLFVWAWLVGAGLVLLSYEIKAKEPEWSTLAESAGIAILVGGVVDGMFKCFEYMGVFERQLDSVKALFTGHTAEVRTTYGALSADLEKMKTDGRVILRSLFDDQLADVRQIFNDQLVDLVYSPKWLVDRRDIEKIWRSVSRAMFPDITTQLEDIILGKYFPVGFYFANASHVIEIELLDVNGQDYINVVETVRYDVKPATGAPGEINLPYRMDIEKDPHDEGTNWKLSYVKIDGQPVEDHPHTVETTTNDENKCVLRATVPLMLSGLKQQTVEVKHEKTYSLQLNDSKVFETSRVLNVLAVRVKYGEELSVSFRSVGTAEDFKDDISFKNEISKRYDSIIFGNQGYTLHFERRKARN